MIDLNMPGMYCRDVLKELKSNESLSPIPIVVLTTSSSTTDRETSYRLGANCFLTKPDSYQKLLELTDSIAKLWF
jgi:CheY-like chemotaxis protein